MQLDGAGRSMTLLADDDLGLAVDQRHFQLTLLVFRRADLGLLVLEVIFLAVHEQHDVGVLFDRAGFAKVGQLRALVVARLDLTRELRQRDNRNIEFLRQRLQAGGDLGDFLHAVVGTLARTRQELDVVDDEKVEALLPLQPTRARHQLRDGAAAGVVDMEGQVLHFRGVIANFFEIVFGNAAAPDRAGGNSGALRQNTGGELLGGHFQREEADYAAIAGYHRSVRLQLALPRTRDII